VRNAAVGVGASGHVLPQPLHIGAVVGYGTSAFGVGALGGVMEEEEALLLVPSSDDVISFGFGHLTSTVARRCAFAMVLGR